MTSHVIRQAVLQDAEAIAKIHVQSWQESYKGIIGQSFLDNISYEKRLEMRRKILNANDVMTYVACNPQNEIVAFCDRGPAHNCSEAEWEIYAIYVLEKYKHQGIGKKLFEHAGKDLSSVIAWVLKENKTARRFYEGQGGQLIQKHAIKIGTQSLDEVCYFFKNSTKTTGDS